MVSRQLVGMHPSKDILKVSVHPLSFNNFFDHLEATNNCRRPSSSQSCFWDLSPLIFDNFANILVYIHFRAPINSFTNWLYLFTDLISFQIVKFTCLHVVPFSTSLLDNNFSHIYLPTDGNCGCIHLPLKTISIAGDAGQSESKCSLISHQSILTSLKYLKLISSTVYILFVHSIEYKLTKIYSLLIGVFKPV